MDYKLNNKGCKKVANKVEKIIAFMYQEFVSQIKKSTCEELCKLIEQSELDLTLADLMDSKTSPNGFSDLYLYDFIDGQSPPDKKYATTMRITLYFRDKLGNDFMLDRPTYNAALSAAEVVGAQMAARFNDDTTTVRSIDCGTQKVSDVQKFYLEIDIRMVLAESDVT